MTLPASLKSFVNADGRVTRLPVKMSKKIELSRWLLQLVEPGRRYTERELTDLFEAYVDDFALMRRMLVEDGSIERERDGSAYWRVESRNQTVPAANAAMPSQPNDIIDSPKQ
jgi:hypothetical protein